MVDLKQELRAVRTPGGRIWRREELLVGAVVQRGAVGGEGDERERACEREDAAGARQNRRG